MASSSEGGRRGEKPPPPPQPPGSSIEDKPATPAEVKSGEKKKMKKKKVRMSQEQIASYLSFRKTPPIPLRERRLLDSLSKEFLATLPQEALDSLAFFDLDANKNIAEINKIDADLAREADDVRRQYMEKGYVEYEVEVEEEEEEEDAPARSAPPAVGRRRHRPGVARRSGTTKRIN